MEVTIMFAGLWGNVSASHRVGMNIPQMGLNIRIRRGVSGSASFYTSTSTKDGIKMTKKNPAVIKPIARNPHKLRVGLSVHLLHKSCL